MTRSWADCVRIWSILHKVAAKAAQQEKTDKAAAQKEKEKTDKAAAAQKEKADKATQRKEKANEAARKKEKADQAAAQKDKGDKEKAQKEKAQKEGVDKPVKSHQSRQPGSLIGLEHCWDCDTDVPEAEYSARGQCCQDKVACVERNRIKATQKRVKKSWSKYD